MRWKDLSLIKQQKIPCVSLSKAHMMDFYYSMIQRKGTSKNVKIQQIYESE